MDYNLSVRIVKKELEGWSNDRPATEIERHRERERERKSEGARESARDREKERERDRES